MDAYSSGHLVLSHLELSRVLVLGRSFYNLSCLRTLNLKYPSVFLSNTQVAKKKQIPLWWSRMSYMYRNWYCHAHARVIGVNWGCVHSVSNCILFDEPQPPASFSGGYGRHSLKTKYFQLLQNCSMAWNICIDFVSLWPCLFSKSYVLLWHLTTQLD